MASDEHARTGWTNRAEGNNVRQRMRIGKHQRYIGRTKRQWIGTRRERSTKRSVLFFGRGVSRRDDRNRTVRDTTVVMYTVAERENRQRHGRRPRLHGVWQTARPIGPDCQNDDAARRSCVQRALPRDAISYVLLRKV